MGFALVGLEKKKQRLHLKKGNGQTGKGFRLHLVPKLLYIYIYVYIYMYIIYIYNIYNIYIHVFFTL